jgi:hypothetical protein
MIPMAKRDTTVTVPSMPDTAHLIVDLHVSRESISGSLQSPSGEPTEFDGWLGLISIIERTQAHLGGQEARGINTPELPPDEQLGPAHEPGRGPS